MGAILDNDGAIPVLVCRMNAGCWIPLLVLGGGGLFVCALTVGLWVLAWRWGG